MKNLSGPSREYGSRFAVPPTPSNNELQRSAAIPIDVLHANHTWMFPVQPQGKPVPAKCKSETRPPTWQQLRR